MGTVSGPAGCLCIYMYLYVLFMHYYQILDNIYKFIYVSSRESW